MTKITNIPKTIPEGNYLIPDGCTITRSGNILSVRKKICNKLTEDEYRCKDCVHRVKGYSLNSGHYPTMVCEELPKREGKDGIMRYKAVTKYGLPCTKFEKK